MTHIFKVLAIAVATVFLTASIADAQSRKRGKKRASPQAAAATASYGGVPNCVGGFFIIEDGGTTRCRHPNGKVCTIAQGASNRATVRECK